MAAFGIALFFVLIAEMGDKSQLVILAFAARYALSSVAGGILLGAVLVQFVAVALGQAATLVVPLTWIQVSSGLAFIAFGVWTLLGPRVEPDRPTPRAHFGPMLTVAVTFFLSEFGDKTMLASIAIAGQQQAFIPVWLGATTGMVVADGVAIVTGRFLGKRLPERFIRRGSAAIFLVSGIVTLAWVFFGWPAE